MTSIRLIASIRANRYWMIGSDAALGQTKQAAPPERTWFARAKLSSPITPSLLALSRKQRFQVGSEGTCRIPFPLWCWLV